MSDQINTPNDRPDVDAPRRTRLKMVLLRALVISLAACALTAVVALLIGEFTDTTGRILGTLATLAVHSGLAMACAESLERQRWPLLSRVGLVLFAASFTLLITCIWWPNLPEEELGRAIGTTGTLLAAYILAIPCADLLERGVWRPLATAGLITAGLGAAMVLVCIWARDAENVAFVKATVIMCIAAFTFAQTALLVRVPAGRSVTRIFWGTLACAWILTAMISIMIIAELEDEFLIRMAGAIGVLDSAGSLSLLILAKLHVLGRREQLTTTAAEVELRCPRCTRQQAVATGAAACSSCGLRFRIEIEEPRCAKCDYLLWQLPERRCPECGTEF